MVPACLCDYCGTCLYQEEGLAVHEVREAAVREDPHGQDLPPPQVGLSGLVVRVPATGLESGPGASPQSGLRGGKSLREYCTKKISWQPVLLNHLILS